VPSDAPTIDYRQLLEDERRQLASELTELGFGEGGGRGLDYDPNFADSSQVTAERADAERLATDLRDALDEVDAALERLANGQFGICEVCGKPIGAARLEAMPAARLCIDDAAKQ
jgi:RNA polymerase-binding transcription factor DksA